MSGRNSPAGPLSIMSGRNSPVSPGFLSRENFSFDDEFKQDRKEMEGEVELPGDQLQQDSLPDHVLNKPVLELSESPSPQTVHSPGEIVPGSTPQVTITSEDEIERRLVESVNEGKE